MSSPFFPYLGVLCAIGINVIVWTTWWIWQARGDRALAMIRDGEGLLLHVDPRGKLDEGHLVGGRHIPVEELGSRARELGDRARTIVVCSHHWLRTRRAVKVLREMGFKATAISH
jgi:rhodanese-related sulfurtransferase